MVVPDGQRRLLLLVGLFAGKVSGKTKFQKLVYLVQRESNIDRLRNVFPFEPYLYGPFSSDVAAAIDELAREKLLSPTPYLFMSQGQTRSASSFELTDAGRQTAEKMAQASSPEELAAMRSIVDKYRFEPLPRILEYVYSRYPEFAGSARKD